MARGDDHCRKFSGRCLSVFRCISHRRITTLGVRGYGDHPRSDKARRGPRARVTCTLARSVPPPSQSSKDFLSVRHSGFGRRQPKEIMSFSVLGLDSTLLQNLTELGYAEPTPVQLERSLAVLPGCDLLVPSTPGRGTTAPLAIPH